MVRAPAGALSLGCRSLGGFVWGGVFWGVVYRGGFNPALECTNTETFCLPRHEMRSKVYQELPRAVYFANRSGVRAICSDCHMPRAWTDNTARKMQASREVWGICSTPSIRGGSSSTTASCWLGMNGHG